jgi:biopolymer transport protein ExbD
MIRLFFYCATLFLVPLAACSKPQDIPQFGPAEAHIPAEDHLLAEDLDTEVDATEKIARKDQGTESLANDEKVADKKIETLLVALDEKGILTVYGNVYNSFELFANLIKREIEDKRRRKPQENLTIVLDIDRRTDFKIVSDLVDVCRERGISEFRFSVSDQSLALSLPPPPPIDLVDASATPLDVHVLANEDGTLKGIRFQESSVESFERLHQEVKRFALNDRNQHAKVKLRLPCDDGLNWEFVEQAWRTVSRYRNHDGKEIGLVDDLLLFQSQEIEIQIIEEEFETDFVPFDIMDLQLDQNLLKKER